MTDDHKNNFGSDIYNLMVANVCDSMELLKQNITGHKWTPIDDDGNQVYWTHTKQTNKTAVFSASVRYSRTSGKSYEFLEPVEHDTAEKHVSAASIYYIPGETTFGDKSYVVYAEYPVFQRSGGFPDRTLRRSLEITIGGEPAEIVYSNAFDTKWFDSVGRYQMSAKVDELGDFYLNAMSINAVAYTLPRLAKYLNYRNWRLRLMINAAVSTMVDKFVITYPTTDTVVVGTPVYSYTLTKDKFFQAFLTADTVFTSGKTYYKVDSVTGTLVTRPVDPSEIGEEITETLYERYSPSKTYYTRTVSRRRETYSEYADTFGVPIRNEQSLVYRRSTDTVVDPTKHYFTTVDYVNFTEVHPAGTENPLELGWYELANTDYATYYEQSVKYKTEYHEVEGHFVETTDTTSQEGKTYYIREDKRETGAEDPVYQFTAIPMDAGTTLTGTYYELELDPASVQWSGNREDPQTHRFYVPIASGAMVTSGYTYMYPGNEGEEYKTCSLLVEPSGEHYYYRIKSDPYFVYTKDTYFKEPKEKSGGGYEVTKEYFIGSTHRPAVIGTAAQVAAGDADYVQCNYEATTDATFQESTAYYLKDDASYVRAKAGTREEVIKGAADYVVGTAYPVAPYTRFYKCVGPTLIPSDVEVYEQELGYAYTAIGEHEVGKICTDPSWDHYIFSKSADGSYDAVGKAYGYDTVIVGKTKNVTYTDVANCALYRQLIVDDDTSVMTSKFGYLYVDAADEVLTRVKNALNVFMTYYRTTLLMSNRSGTAYRRIADNTQYTTEDIIVRLNSIIGSINKYATHPIAELGTDEYTVRNLKLKVNEIIEFIVDEEYYGNLCKEDAEFKCNLLKFEEDFWNKYMDGGQLQYDMATTSVTPAPIMYLTEDTKYLEGKSYYSKSGSTYTLLVVGEDYEVGDSIEGDVYENKLILSYNDCLFYYEPLLPYIRYIYNKINWGTLYTSGDPEVGDLKKEVIAGTDGSSMDYYYVFVGTYPATDTGTYYGWVPMHYVVNLYQITEMWSFSEYSAAMQVLKLTKNLLETKTPDGNDWKDALSHPRKRGTAATNFDNVLGQINRMEERIDKILKLAPQAARVMVDIFRWCASYNYSSMEQCFPYGK